MSKLPFMQFYPADWLQDTQILSLEAQGAWIKILCALHIASERGRKIWPIASFKQFLGYPEDDRALFLLEVLTQVADIEARDVDGNCCKCWDEAAEVTIISRRMMRDEARRNEELERKRRYETKNPTRRRRSADTNPTRRVQRSEFRVHISEVNKNKRREDNTSHLGTNGSSTLSEDSVSTLTPENLIALYNDTVNDNFSAVEKISEGRLKKARQYLKQFPQREFWLEVFKELNSSAFLAGKKNNPGHESFQANFDWLLSKGKDGTENAVKVYEGKYRE